jgi:hypothetical protein
MGAGYCIIHWLGQFLTTVALSHRVVWCGSAALVSDHV